MPYLTIAKPAFGTLEGFQKIMSAQAIGQGEPEGLQARWSRPRSRRLWPDPEPTRRATKEKGMGVNSA
jgi:hypothetical protein